MTDQSECTCFGKCWVCLRAFSIILMLLLTILLSSHFAPRVTDAAPLAQAKELCLIVPSLEGATIVEESAVTQADERRVCKLKYAWGQLDIKEYRSLEAIAVRLPPLANELLLPNPNKRDLAVEKGIPVGERFAEAIGNFLLDCIAGSAADRQRGILYKCKSGYELGYVRGCYLVQAQSNPTSGYGEDVTQPMIAPVRNAAAALDNKLKTMPACPGLEPDNDLDLSIDHVEVTQAIQDAGNTVPLVADRTTLVRVFIKVTGKPKGPVAGVMIDACGMGTTFRGMTDKCVPAVNKNTPFTAPLNPQRANLTDTLNLFLPNAMTYANTGPTQGTTYPLELWTNPNKTIPETNYDNNRFSVQLTFTPQNRLRIGYLRVGYQPPGQAAATFPSNNVNTYAQLTQKLYPLPDNGLDYNEIPVRRPYHKPLFDPTDPLTKTFALEDQFAATLRKAYDLFTGDKPNQLVAWLPTIPNPVPAGVGITTGQSDPMWWTYEDKTKGAGRVTFVKDWTPRDALFRQDVMAHEMAHNFGLHHTNLPDCGAWDKDSLWPYKTSQIQEFGFDTLTRSLIPNTRFDMMSYCMNPGSNIWISPFSYIQLYNSYLKPRADTSREIAFLERGNSLCLYNLIAQPRQEQLVISGVIRRDGSAGRLDPAYHSADLDPGDSLPTSGNQCLRLSGATRTIATYCFTLPFRAHQSNIVLDEQNFTLKVPYPAGTTRVALVRDNRELATLTASPNAPTLNVTSPRAGDKWDATHTLSWSASDSDGGALTYTVLYTPDGGKSWYPLEVDTRDQQLAINTSEIANGDQVQFRVLASDGLNTAQADSPPIQVRNGIAPVATPQSAGSATALPTDSSSPIVLGLGGAALCGVLGVLFITGFVVATHSRTRSPRASMPPLPRPTTLPERGAPIQSGKPTDLPR